MSFTFRQLQTACTARDIEWCGKENETTDLLFCANELGGEVGETQNWVKKLWRTHMGWKGGVPFLSARLEIAKELADVVICCMRVASCLNIDLGAEIALKFNETSDKHGFKTKIQID